MRLSEVLAARGFVPDRKCVKLVRHTDKRVDLKALRDGLGEQALGADCWLDVYQKYQSKPVFHRCSQIVVFLGEKYPNSRFVGVYDVGAHLPASKSPLPPGCPDPKWASAIRYSQKGREAELFYRLAKRGGFEDIEDRLVIDWGDAPLAWHQWFTDRKVVEIRPRAG